MVADTATRSERQTAECINARIQRLIEANVTYYANHSGEIGARLGELDREWDVDRVVEAHAAGAVLAGILCGCVARKWRALPLLAGGFLMVQALKGWYPALPVLRRLGIRTAREISLERYALKALRGDFGPADPKEDVLARAQKALAGARM